MKRAFPLLAVAVLVFTALWAPQHLKEFRVDSSTDSLILEDDPEAIRYDRTAQTFASDEFSLVGIRRDDLFTKDGVAYIASLHERFAKIPNVVSVWSITRPPAILMRSFKKGAQIPMGFGPATALITSHTLVDMGKARAELTDHELFRGNLVSDDGKTAGVLVTLRTRPESAAALQKKLKLYDRRDGARAKLKDATGEARAKLQDELKQVQGELDAFWPEWVAQEDARKDERIGVIREVRRIVKEERDKGVDARASGVPTLVVEMVEAIQGDLETFSFLSLAFILGFLLLVFRRVRWVVLPLLPIGVTVAITIAVMYSVDKRISVITANIPALLLVIGLAHSIHMIVRYRELLVRFPEDTAPQRVKRLIDALVWPCLFTATTTGAGFLSLYFAGSRPIIDFGFMMALGVGLAFVLSFVFMPAGLVVLPPTDEGRLERSSQALTGLGRLSLRRKGAVLGVAVGITLFSALGMVRLDVEARFIDYFSAESPIHKGLSFIDQHLGGTSGLEVILTADAKGTFDKKENLDKAARVVKWLKDREEVGAVMSYVGLVDELRKSMPPQTTRAQAAFLLKMFFRMQGSLDSLEGYVVTEEKLVAGQKIAPYSKIRIAARVKETHPGLDRSKTLRDVRAFLASEFPADGKIKAETTGMFVLYANMLDSLIGSQIKTSLLALGAIWVMLSLLFLNPFAALLALIPNAIPIGFAIGAMGWAGIPLDMATVMIASVSLGIGIDAAIHYLFRYREEIGIDGDVDAAILRSHASIGTSIFYTSLTCVVGFVVLAFSAFRPNAYFGVLTGFAMVAALFAMLTFLPVLIAWFQPFRKAMRAGAEMKGAGTAEVAEDAEAEERSEEGTTEGTEQSAESAEQEGDDSES